jgi:hypothetical protein
MHGEKGAEVYKSRTDEEKELGSEQCYESREAANGWSFVSFSHCARRPEVNGSEREDTWCGI